jgi:flagellar hook-basal body complex protein FliE
LPALQPQPPQATNQGQGQAPIQATSQAPNLAPNQATASPSGPNDKRGFLNDFGQWWNDSIANFSAKMKEQQAKLDEFSKQQSDAAKDATQAMKNAAGAMFSTSKIIEIQQVCPVAGNGAPDCASAATNVCKAKGFGDGRPMDIRTAERCKASLWVSGQNPTTADCPVETVLLRVACQQ